MDKVGIGTRIPDEATCTWEGVRGYAIYLYKGFYCVTHESIIQSCHLIADDASKAYAALAWPIIPPDPAYLSAMAYIDRLKKEIWMMCGVNEADLGDVTVEGNHPSVGYSPTEWQKEYYGGFREKFTRDSTGVHVVKNGRSFGKLYRAKEEMQGEKIRGLEFDEAVFVSDFKPNESGVFHRDWLRSLPKSVEIKAEFTSEGSIQKLIDTLTGSSYVAVKNTDGNTFTHTFTNYLPVKHFTKEERVTAFQAMLTETGHTYYPGGYTGNWSLWSMLHPHKPILKRGHKSGRKHPYRTKRDRVRYQKR